LSSSPNTTKLEITHEPAHPVSNDYDQEDSSDDEEHGEDVKFQST